MKNFLFLSLFGLLMTLCSCDYIGNKAPSIDTAEAQFISEAQILSEQDALSKEISWYKTPQITERTVSRNLTGKDVIHEPPHSLLRE